MREEKQFHPTELGIVVIELLTEYFPDIIDIEFTANLENRLDEIDDGQIEWKNILRDFYQTFKNELDHAENEIGKIKVEDEVSDEICDKCGRNYVVKFGRYGKFLACPGFPECRSTKPLLEEVGVDCPKCQKGQVVVRRSKKGRKFFGCSDYPQCDFLNWDKPTKEKCPQCNSTIVEKSAGKGLRKVCSNKECNYQSSTQTRAELE